MGRLEKTVMTMGICAGLVSVLSASPAIGQQVTSSLRQGLPGRRISGGTRSECMAGSAPIVALNPSTNISKTVSDRPSVYFVVPSLEQNYRLMFSLRDAAGARVYEMSLDTAEHTGIVGIQLPEKSLEVNQDYRWYLSVVCDVQDPSQNDVLSGWLRQVSAEVALELNESGTHSLETGLAIASHYQEAGLLNDAVDTLVTLHEKFPHEDSLHQAWHQLLQALELEAAVGNASITSR